MQHAPLSSLKQTVRFLNIDKKYFKYARLTRETSEHRLTIVVSVMDPKLLMKMLQVTFTGGPEGRAHAPLPSDEIHEFTSLSVYAGPRPAAFAALKQISREN